MQTVRIDVGVLLVGGGPVETTGAETVELDFVRPDVFI